MRMSDTSWTMATKSVIIVTETDKDGACLQLDGGDRLSHFWQTWAQVDGLLAKLETAKLLAPDRKMG